LAIAVSSYCANAQTSLAIPDTRSDVTTPSTYSHSFVPYFKSAATLGLPSFGSTYFTTIGFRGWEADNSGGKAHELAFGDDSRIFFRSGNSPSWEGWQQLLVMDENGKVGIGTTTPTDLLTLNVGANRKGITIASDGDLAAYTDLTLAINSSGSVTTGAPLGWDISHRKDGYFSETPSGHSSLEFYAYLQGGGYYAPLSFKPDGNVVLVSNRNALGGNVLIGKTSQVNTAYKLDVNGKARANEIVVNTSGADFVFDKKYTLPKLSDVKAYINKNQHLPEMPSAKEMQTNGMSVGEINTKLLQKVEELTLYIIEKDKQLTGQQKQIDELKTQVAKLLKQ